MSLGLLTSRREKTKLFKNSKAFPTPENKLMYINFRNLYNTTIRNAKKLFYEKQFVKFQSNIKKSWQLLYSAIKKKTKSSSTISSISFNDRTFTDPRAIAKRFNEFFTTAAINIVSELQPCEPTDRPPDSPPNNFSFSFSNDPVTLSEISDVIKSMEPKKTQDSDGLSVFLISKISQTLLSPLQHLISRSFLTGIVPKQLKIAKIIPIFKSGDAQSMDNYRPISLLNTFSKIYEKIACNRVTTYLETNSLLTDSQFGFRRNHSTVHPLTKFLNFLASANNNKQHAIAIFCDLRKAFDTCDHVILLSKLKKLGIKGIELAWFQNYLTDRKQFVFINGCSSKL
jgi:hypothetical protein